MKRFLKMLGIWLAILLVFAIGADYVISKGLRTSNLRKYAVWNDILNSNVDADLLILGSSETWCGYDPHVFDSVLNCNSYNFGIVGHRFRYLFMRYDTYKKYCPQPKAILLNLAYVDAFGDEENNYEREQFFPFFNDRKWVKELTPELHFTMMERYLPFYRYFGFREEIESGVESFFGKKSFVDGVYKGYKGYEEKWLPGSLYMDTIFEAPIDPEIVDELNAFIRDRKAEGIKMVIVNFPEYHALQDKFRNFHEVDSVFLDFAVKNDIPFLDFTDSEFSYDSAYYYNPSHLNRRGAKLFSSMVCQKVDSLQLLK